MNEFKRKQWTRIALSVIAVAVAALFLTGIIGGQNMTYRIGENASAVTASEQGFGGEVTVQMELNGDNTVKSLAIDTPDETEGLGKRASEAEFMDQFIGKAGPFTFGEDGIEALSGLGLMVGIKTTRPASEVVADCMQNGVLCLTAKDKVRLLPALNIPDELLIRAADVIKAACAKA